MRRRLRLVTLIALFTLGLFPRTSAPANASPVSSGRIVAREVTLDAPVAQAVGPSVGSIGDSGPDYVSGSIAADQLFDRLGIHWTQRMLTESVAMEVRSSPDGVTWSGWTAVTDDDDMYDTDRNEHYGAPLPIDGGARFAQFRASGNTSALLRVGITFMDVTDLNAGPVARLLNDVQSAMASFGGSYASAASGASKVLTRQDWAAD
ncbi:MAG: hypothetical protein M3O64_04975, partial [Chloroflexota bacterium]|nr:hypothetical protein [Chloroflexota bacterium]